MKVIECAQGSPEWHRARAGVITASMFGIARKKVGGLTEQQEKYVAAIKSGATEKRRGILLGTRRRQRLKQWLRHLLDCL